MSNVIALRYSRPSRTRGLKHGFSVRFFTAFRVHYGRVDLNAWWCIKKYAD